MNSVNLTGRLTKAFDLKYAQSGTAIARNSIAVKRKTPNAQGEYETDFINLLAFGKTAENLNKYFNKGNMIGIQGRIQTGSYDNTQGQKVYTSDVVVESFDFLESRATRENQSTSNQATHYNTMRSVSEDDLPF